jgi:hypothetical protein
MMDDVILLYGMGNWSWVNSREGEGAEKSIEKIELAY